LFFFSPRFPDFGMVGHFFSSSFRAFRWIANVIVPLRCPIGARNLSLLSRTPSKASPLLVRCELRTTSSSPRPPHHACHLSPPRRHSTARSNFCRQHVVVPICTPFHPSAPNSPPPPFFETAPSSRAAFFLDPTSTPCPTINRNFSPVPPDFLLYDTLSHLWFPTRANQAHLFWKLLFAAPIYFFSSFPLILMNLIFFFPLLSCCSRSSSILLTASRFHNHAHRRFSFLNLYVPWDRRSFSSSCQRSVHTVPDPGCIDIAFFVLFSFSSDPLHARLRTPIF